MSIAGPASERSISPLADIGVRADEIHRIAATGDGIDVVYQPIVDLRRRRTDGFEALARITSAGVPPMSPDRWFAEAYRVDAGEQLDARVLTIALRQRRHLPRNHFLSVNVEPQALLSDAVMSVICDGRDLRGMIVELTEHRRFELTDVASSIDRLRRHGAMIALDDAGAGYAGMQQILLMKPSVLKLDRTLVEDIDRDETKVAMVEMLGIFANRIDAWVIAEGIETTAEAQRLVALGVPLAQGYFFARPAPAWPVLERDAVASLDCFADRTRETLHHLVEAVPFRTELGLGLGNGRDHGPRWQAVVDSTSRPVGLIDHRRSGANRTVPTLTANVSTSPIEIAYRVVTSDADPSAPIVVVGDDGNYVGLVTIRRLLADLADRAGAT